MKQNPSQNNKVAGFTLVEMIISLGIFSVVAVIALGALVRIVSANQKAQTLFSSVSSLSSALEAMSRELRVATVYHCAKSGDGSNLSRWMGSAELTLKTCPISAGDLSVIAFKSSQVGENYNRTEQCALIYIYRFIKDGSNVIHLQKAEQEVCGYNVGDDINIDNYANSAYSDVVSTSNVVIDDYRLGVLNNNGNSLYPLLYIRIEGHAGEREKERSYFDIQTTISSRTPQT